MWTKREKEREMNNYVKHFRRELKILEDSLAEGDNLVIKDFISDIENITEKFCKQGNSGMSVGLTIPVISNTLKKVLSFQPLSPIIGDEKEWNNIGNGEYQNNRLSSILKKRKDGKPYYLRAIVWRGEEDYDSFTGTVEGISSRQYIKLPFTPKTFYVDVVAGEDGEYKIKDKNQLRAVFEYYEEYKD